MPLKSQHMLSLINATASSLMWPWHVIPVAPQRQYRAALLKCSSASQMAGNRTLVLQTPAHLPLIHTGIVLLIYWSIYRCSNKSQNPTKNITRGRDLDRTKLRWRQSQEPRRARCLPWCPPSALLPHAPFTRFVSRSKATDWTTTTLPPPATSAERTTLPPSCQLPQSSQARPLPIRECCNQRETVNDSDNESNSFHLSLKSAQLY